MPVGLEYQDLGRLQGHCMLLVTTHRRARGPPTSSSGVPVAEVLESRDGHSVAKLLPASVLNPDS